MEVGVRAGEGAARGGELTHPTSSPYKPTLFAQSASFAWSSQPGEEEEEEKEEEEEEEKEEEEDRQEEAPEETAKE